MSGRHAPAYTPEQREDVIRRYELGQSQTQIAEATKVKKSTVDSWIQAHRRGLKVGQPPVDDEPLEEVVANYVERVSALTHRSLTEIEQSGKQVDPAKLEKVLKVISDLDKLARQNPANTRKPESALEKLAGDLPPESEAA